VRAVAVRWACHAWPKRCGRAGAAREAGVAVSRIGLELASRPASATQVRPALPSISATRTSQYSAYSMRPGHALGHAWQAHRPQRASAPRRRRQIAVVHNGIIENFAALRAEAGAIGGRVTSDTDTEVAVHLVAWQYKPRRERRRLRGLRARGAAPAGGSLHTGVANATSRHHRRGRRSRRWLSESATARCSSAPMSPPHRAHSRRPSNRSGPGGGAHCRRYEIFDSTATWMTAMLVLSHRLGPVGRRKGRLRVLHAQRRCGAARRGLDTLPATSPTAASCSTNSAFRPGASRDRQGVRRRLRTPIIRPAGQVPIEHWTRLPSSRTGQRIPLRDPVLDSHTLVVAISQSGETADTLRRCATPRSRRPGAGHLQHQRFADSARMRRRAHTRPPEIVSRRPKTFPGQIAANYLVGLALRRPAVQVPTRVEREYRALEAMPT